MGKLVDRNGPLKTIGAHVETSLTNSNARGGKIAAIAAVELAPAHASLTQIKEDLVQARKAAATVEAAVIVAKDTACGVVKRVHDDAWNDIGRPRHDPAFALLFPDGCAFYAAIEVNKLPGRMELLARLFEKNLHPKLSADQHQTAADRVRMASSEFEAALDAAKLPTANVELLERTLTAMTRSAQTSLSGFKRALKNAGFTEAEIHEVIPDCPKPAAKKAAKGQAPAAADASAKDQMSAPPGESQAIEPQPA